MIVGALSIVYSLYLPNYESLASEKTDEISWQQVQIQNCPNEQCQNAIGNTIKTLENIQSDYNTWIHIKNALLIIGIVLVVLPIIPKLLDYVVALFS